MNAQIIIFQIRNGDMTYGWGEEYLKDYGYTSDQVLNMVAAQSRLEQQSKGRH